MAGRRNRVSFLPGVPSTVDVVCSGCVRKENRKEGKNASEEEKNANRAIVKSKANTKENVNLTHKSAILICINFNKNGNFSYFFHHHLLSIAGDSVFSSILCHSAKERAKKKKQNVKDIFVMKIYTLSIKLCMLNGNYYVRKSSSQVIALKIICPQKRKKNCL
jgi:hypothetical protein